MPTRSGPPLNAKLPHDLRSFCNRALCATCYTLKRQDEEHFSGLRETVLERDDYRCRVCEASGRDKRFIVVHHRVPGKSILNLMISRCPECHAKVHRIKAMLRFMPPLLAKLWREQHPLGSEQMMLNFSADKPIAGPFRCSQTSRKGKAERAAFVAISH
jgi:hypothetical protein